MWAVQTVKDEEKRSNVVDELGHLVFYWWSMITMHIYCTITEIQSLKHIGVTTLTFYGHLTSPVDSPSPITLPKTKPEVDPMRGC